MNKFGKYFLLVTGFALLATFARIPGANIKVHAHNGACSVASLKGTYAYLRSGSVMGQGPRAEMGLSLFNGDGKRGIIRFTGSSLIIPSTGPINRGRTEATRSIRIVPARSSMQMVQKPTTSSSLTEARDSWCSPLGQMGRARLSRERGRGWRRRTTNGALAKLDAHFCI